MSRDGNIVRWVTKALEPDEQVEAVVIGDMGWSGGYNSEDVPNFADQPKGRCLTWDEAQKWLDYNFCAGYGAPGCNAVYVWTNQRVMWVTQYDGSTYLSSMPRHPIDVMPDMPGG